MKDEFDFNFECTENTKTDYRRELAIEMLKEEYLHRCVRRKKLSEYRISNTDENIKYCAECGESNLEVEKREVEIRIKIYLVDCPDCGSPVLFLKQGSKRPIVNPAINERQGDCFACEDFKDASEFECQIDGLIPNAEAEASFSAVYREIRKNMIDRHHLKYKDSHGEEITIPLCKPCHQKVTVQDNHCLSNKQIDPDERIEPPTLFGRDIELEQ